LHIRCGTMADSSAWILISRRLRLHFHRRSEMGPGPRSGPHFTCVPCMRRIAAQTASENGEPVRPTRCSRLIG
jgi:hypothetical protein